MNKTDTQSTATLLALGLLSDGEAREAAAALSESMPQRLQVAAVQDIATALLLSECQRAVMPPGDTLANIQRRIAEKERLFLWRDRGLTVIRWGGWVAAAAMAALMSWPQDLGVQGPGVAESAGQGADRLDRVASLPSQPSTAVVAAEAGSSELRNELQALRNEVARLQSQVGGAKLANSGAASVSVLSFSKDGKQTPLNSILPQGSALSNVLATALRPYLLRNADGKAIGPEIVIESGFGAFTAATLPDGYYFRHLHFPSKDAAGIGLVAGADGSFYDPNGQLIWRADPVQPSTFLGYRPTTDLELAQYEGGVGSAIASNAEATPTAPVRELPPLVAIIDPLTQAGTAILPGLIDATPPIPGAVPQLWKSKTNPITGKSVYEAIGSPVFERSPADLLLAANNPGKPVIGYVNLTAQDVKSLQQGQISLTWESTSGMVLANSSTAGGGVADTDLAANSNRNIELSNIRAMSDNTTLQGAKTGIGVGTTFNSGSVGNTRVDSSEFSGLNFIYGGSTQVGSLSVSGSNIASFGAVGWLSNPTSVPVVIINGQPGGTN
jgi:hypothetical protein